MLTTFRSDRINIKIQMTCIRIGHLSLPLKKEFHSSEMYLKEIRGHRLMYIQHHFITTVHNHKFKGMNLTEGKRQNQFTTILSVSRFISLYRDT